jgi:pyruvate dehydrogenase E1 component alpha subunit
MSNTKELTFAPTGRDPEFNSLVHKSTTLPEPTKKTHKQLKLSDEKLLEFFEQMYLQRRFEERAAQMYQKGKFGGFLHLYIGQEAISTGTVAAFDENDDIITGYRDHGWGLVRGISARAGMAELFGKHEGCSKGKGGSMHFVNAERHFWGGYGIVGGHIPIGAGLAMANKYNKTGTIAACFFGDGAVDQGSLHETMNIAQLWKLPVIFVVENNGYSMGTAVRRHTVNEIVDRAKGYGMKSALINGMEVLSVYEGMKKVADEVRKTQEPCFVEIRTYRYRGHSMSDPQKYRTKDELEEYKNIDPIERLKSYMLSKKVTDEETLKSIMAKVDEEVLEAVNFADEASQPPLEELYDHVMVEDNYPFHT